MAYKRELIINNGSLTSYKKLLKVSDVCQLIDASKYPATKTINGVTFTNNGDGTITANGTATSSIYFDIITDWLKLSTDKKYLIIGCPSGGRNDTYFLYVNNGGALWRPYDTGNGSIGTPIKINAIVTICITGGTTANNLVFKPQLFDLTEMYGAGNEPATVEEFKAKFPNEMYDYSPRCWVKSYKTGLIAKTKNLFDINALTPYTPETLPRGMAGIYNGNIISKGKPNDTTCSTGKTLRELCPDLLVGETYILNFETNVPSSVGGQYESIHLRGSGNWWRLNYRTITEADLSATVFIYAEVDGATYTIWNFQIEKGSTATDYVPYGYL